MPDNFTHGQIMLNLRGLLANPIIRHMTACCVFGGVALVIWGIGFTDSPQGTSCKINGIVPINGQCVYNVTVLLSPVFPGTIYDTCFPGYTPGVVEPCYYSSTVPNVTWYYSYYFTIATFVAISCAGVSVVNALLMGCYVIIKCLDCRQAPVATLAQESTLPDINDLDAFSRDGPTGMPHPPLYEVALNMHVIVEVVEADSPPSTSQSPLLAPPSPPLYAVAMSMPVVTVGAPHT